MDVERRVAHRLSSGLERYRSLAASADGRRLVLTLARDKGTFWSLPISDQPVDASAGTEMRLTTGRGLSPRLGPGYLVFVVSAGSGESIWKRTDEGTETELWAGPDAHIVGAPGIDPDGRRIAFSVEQGGKTSLYIMNADGTNPRVVDGSLDLRGFLAWAPDGRSVTSAANVNGTPHLFQIALDGSHVPLVQDFAVDPAWAPEGDVVLYSGRDVGTTFSVKAATAAGASYPLRVLTLTRGGRRIRFLGPRSIVVMRGDLQHKDLWRIDLDTGLERQLTRFAADFNIRDFDVSRDGRRIVVERSQDQSDIVMLDRTAK
jgi:Tol biopolymer transport system component